MIKPRIRCHTHIAAGPPHAILRSRRPLRRRLKPSHSSPNIRPEQWRLHSARSHRLRRSRRLHLPLRRQDPRPAGMANPVSGASKTASSWASPPPEHVAGNTFLVYHGVEAKDFDLKLEIKVERGGGSGIQYRSSTGIPPGRVAGKGEPPLDPRWVMIGPQADFWFGLNEHTKQYSGQLYSQNTSAASSPGAGRWSRRCPESLRNWSATSVTGAVGHFRQRRRVEPVHDHRPRRRHHAHPQWPAYGRARRRRSNFIQQHLRFVRPADGRHSLQSLFSQSLAEENQLRILEHLRDRERGGNENGE